MLYWISEFLTDTKVIVQLRNGYSYRGHLIAIYTGYYNKKTKYYELYRTEVIADNTETKAKAKVSKNAMLLMPSVKRINE